MTKRTPAFIFLFISIVVGAFIGLAFLFPDNGVELPYGFRFKYPSIDKLINHEKPVYADVSGAIHMAESISSSIETEVESFIHDVLQDSTEDTSETVPIYQFVNVDSLRAAEKYLQPIQFPQNGAVVLNHFFKALDKATSKGEKTHVIHYGDSQIEGDRMTSYIRDRLQKRFGGYGVGLVPASNINQVPFIGQENSENWFRYPAFFKEGATGETDRYGAMVAYSSYTPFPTNLAESELTQAWVRYNSESAIFNSSKKFRQVRFFYGPVYDRVKMSFPVGDTIFADYFAGDAPFNKLLLDFNEPITEVELRFESKLSPQIYGVSLEGRGGVQVDNIAMRGSSGTVFHNMDFEILKSMLDELNTSLIIMQFGGNVMPYMETENQASDYGRYFLRQLQILKKARPNASIIVIGPADMSVKMENYYVTYPLMANVREALKNAAFKADAGYWDMFLAMGGENSMPSWVTAVPPLAASDYTHFTPRGARVISEFFYKALILEYESYKNQQLAQNSAQ
jgi:lysophospholipase L1-like esterase